MTEIKTVAQYMKELSADRREPMQKLRKAVKAHLPAGFKETLNYGMPAWVVPHSLYKAGYHVDPSLPLPFISIVSQKSHIALYHMGLYADPKLLHWFVEQYPKYVKTKLDMGKSCIRFKKPDQIPFELVGQLCRKMTPKQWIRIYEEQVNR